MVMLSSKKSPTHWRRFLTASVRSGREGSDGGIGAQRASGVLGLKRPSSFVAGDGDAGLLICAMNKWNELLRGVRVLHMHPRLAILTPMQPPCLL